MYTDILQNMYTDFSIALKRLSRTETLATAAMINIPVRVQYIHGRSFSVRTSVI
uniref:Uncharacterized protein n=1 Tax=Anguilla anguilla TaxID=7936 RepID=A0A0E9UCZ1_ANGAN